MTNIKKDNKILIYPGETLSELLDERSMTQAELADRIGRPYKTINEIIKGKTGITPETAIQFERVFGVPANFWLNLENNYQLALIRANFEKNIQTEFEVAKKYPYKEMVRLGWVSVENNMEKIVQGLLDFFGVTSLKNIIEKNIFVGVQYRISVKKEYSKEAIIAWLRKGVIDAQKIDTKDFDERRLKDNLVNIRSLILSNSQDFLPKIVKILADCGIALVITKNLRNAPINGATRWISPKKALIQMSIRGKYSDIFWFSLFHEIGHLLLHQKKDVHIDFGEDGINEEQERQADEFAAEFLIPKEKLNNFLIKADRFNYSNSIRLFAREIKVSPGIVIGRLQHDKVISLNQFNGLRLKYEWVS
ncbi:MAG: HigA family addiction module antitoxin [Candidatus Falkowbacteria bacterium]